MSGTRRGSPARRICSRPASPGTQSATRRASTRGSNLYRVYVFSDKNCVNRIFTGSIVGGPAWAPRSVSRPDAASERRGHDCRRGAAVPPTRAAPTDARRRHRRNRGLERDGGSQVGSTARRRHRRTQPPRPTASRASISGIPAGRAAASTGRSCRSRGSRSCSYTKLPSTADRRPSSGSASTAGGRPVRPAPRRSDDYDDTAPPRARRRARRPRRIRTRPFRRTPASPAQCMSFGKVSQPIVTSSGTPFLSGVGPDGPERGRSRAARRRLLVPDRCLAARRRRDQVPDRDVADELPLARRRSTFGTPATSIVLPADHRAMPARGTTASAAINQNLP